MAACMGGFELMKEDDPLNKQRLSHENFVSELEGYDVDFSEISKGVILERSKGDAMAKGFVVLQTGWFAMQCVARVAQGLPVTELELTTLGHVATVSITYFLWWNKPLDVQHPITLHARVRRETINDIDGGTGEEVRDSDTRDIGSESHGPTLMTESQSFKFSWRMRMVLYLDDGSPVLVGFLALIIGLLVPGLFGAIHCLGWNSHFPSHVEQLLWRISALVVTLLPFAIASSIAVAEDAPAVSWKVAFGSISVLYIAARLCLIILAFLGLRNLPFAAHQTPSWTNFIPHL